MKDLKITLKLRLMLLLLCCGMTVFAQQIEIEVPTISGLESALKAKYSDELIAGITDLKVSGDMEMLAQKLDVPNRTASR